MILVSLFLNRLKVRLVISFLMNCLIRVLIWLIRNFFGLLKSVTMFCSIFFMVPSLFRVWVKLRMFLIL